MPAAFFWLAVFPMILGGIILFIFIVFLKREGRKPAKTDSRKLTPEKFISEVARYANMNQAEAERMVEFVFSHFPGFDWKRHLPTIRDMERHGDNEGKKS